MLEFQRNKDNFARKFCIGFFRDLSIVALLLIFFNSNYSLFLPGWLEKVTLVIYFFFILLGLVLYPKAKRNSENFSIFFFKDALGFTFNNEIKKIPYGNIKLIGTRKKNGKIIEIFLEVDSSGKVDLRGLNDMDKLHDELLKKLPSAH